MMLMYDGHAFGTDNLCRCCVTDAKVVIDPTNTGRLRSKFRNDFGIRWNKLRLAVRNIVVGQDLLAIKSGGLGSTSAPGIVNSATRVEVFQRWIEQATDKIVVGGNVWMGPYLREAFAAGTQFGEDRLEVAPVDADEHRSATMQMLARIELQGVVQAVVQQATRAVANGLLGAMTPMQITRNVWSVIDKVGRLRADAMVEMLVIRAHSEAALDVYEANGVTSVGVLPEARAVRKLGALDAKGKSKAKGGSKVARPGSRSKKATPSQRTIQRIRALELKIAKQLGEKVNVETAGDDLVCPVCESISEGGPYTISRARSLIPAHPRCRCVFVPDESTAEEVDASEEVDDAAPLVPVQDEFNESDHPRDPDGKFASGGGLGTKFDPAMKVKGTSAERVGLRKDLANSKDPAERKMIQQKIIESFHKQHQKKPDPDIAAKLAKYSKQYGIANPLNGTPAMAPGGYVAHKSYGPKVEATAAKLMKENPPVPQAPQIQHSPEEQEAFKQLSSLHSSEQAKMWMNAGKQLKAKEPYSPASAVDLAHINAYTGAGYGKVNRELRLGSMDEHTFNHSRALNNALDKLPRHEGTVYRKAQLSKEQADLYKPGRVVQERGFTSTSRNPGTWSGSHQYVIKSKTGRHVAPYSRHQSEDEVLFKSGSHFKVTKVEGNKIHMEEL